MGRLKPGVTMQQAQADMDTVTANIAAAYPKSNKGWGASVEPLKNDFLPPERIRNLWLLLGAVGFVLLITCVNIANLLLAKGAVRQREIAIRSSMGATRATDLRPISYREPGARACSAADSASPSPRDCCASSSASFPKESCPRKRISNWISRSSRLRWLPPPCAGLLFGCAPAWFASRVDPAESLKDGGRSSTGAGSQKLRRMLIMGEFALALSLLAGAGLAIHSFWNLTRVDVGVRTDHVLTFELRQPQGRFENPAADRNLQ